VNQHFQGISPQYTRYQRTRRFFPSPMQGEIVDRAADRLTLSGHILADVPAWRLLRLLTLPATTRAEADQIRAELRRRQEHCVSEEDIAELRRLVVTL
jgi:hypothetical protein